jgi:hypothetical protein
VQLDVSQLTSDIDSLSSIRQELATVVGQAQLNKTDQVLLRLPSTGVHTLEPLDAAGELFDEMAEVKC